MTVSFRGWMGFAGIGMILAAALIPAFGLPYLFGAPFAAGAVALLLGAEELLRRRTVRALQALAAGAGSAVREHAEEESAAWLGALGFADYSRQPVRRLRVKSADAIGGTASYVWMSLGPGKPRVHVFVVISAPARTAGTACLRARSLGERLRAHSIGGAVSAGSPVDERFVVYAPDAESAKEAVRCLDLDAVEALLKRVRVLAGTKEVSFTVVPGRASVMASGAPAELFAPEAMREIVQALAASGRARH